MKPIHTENYKGYTINIYPDPDPINPRSEEYTDNLGTMVCWHGRYTLGDDHKYDNSVEFLTDLTGLNCDNSELISIEKEMQNRAILEAIKSKVVMLPLFLYDHSGITISTTSFSCPWDSGQVGFIYVTKQKLEQEGLNDRTDLEIANILRSEVETYDNYLTGAVYGREITYGNCELDTVWGYFGSDFESNGLLQDARASIDHAIKEKSETHFSRLKAWIKNKVPLMYRQPLSIAL